VVLSIYLTVFVGKYWRGAEVSKKKFFDCNLKPHADMQTDTT